MSTESPVDTKPEPDDYITTLERARELGRSAGRAAGSWYFDGNTDDATYARVLQGIEDGDPEVMDTLPSAPLSGEWADVFSPRDVLAELDTDEDDDAAGDYLRAFEDGYSEGADDVITTTARAHVEAATVTIYIATTSDWIDGSRVVQAVDTKDALSPDTLAPIIEDEIRPADAPELYRRMVDEARAFDGNAKLRPDGVHVAIGDFEGEWSRDDDRAAADRTSAHDTFGLLHGARYVHYRRDLGLLFVWHGTSLIHILDPWWNEVDVFSMANFDEDSASVVDVEQACREYSEPA